MTAKTILVTGCSAGGIGASMALALARRAHHVFATARTVSKIPAELSSFSNVTILTLDTTSAESVAEAAAAVEALGRGLDVLVNNAGVGYTIPVLDVDIDTARRLFDVNVFGVVRTVQGFADLLIRNKGRIVNMSTNGTAVNTPWMGMYQSRQSRFSFHDVPRLLMTWMNSIVHRLQDRPDVLFGDDASRAGTVRRHRRGHHDGHGEHALPR